MPSIGGCNYGQLHELVECRRESLRRCGSRLSGRGGAVRARKSAAVSERVLRNPTTGCLGGACHTARISRWSNQTIASRAPTDSSHSNIPTPSLADIDSSSSCAGIRSSASGCRLLACKRGVLDGVASSPPHQPPDDFRVKRPRPNSIPQLCDSYVVASTLETCRRGGVMHCKYWRAGQNKTANTYVIDIAI